MNHTPIRSSVARLLLRGISPFLMVALLASCATKPAETASCCREVEPAPSLRLPDQSLYQLESTWTTDAGRPLPLRALRGKPRIVAMVFTSCEFACPIIVNDMKRLAAALPPERREQIGFTLISFDPERDTPEKLRAFRARMELPEANWTLLRGAADDVRELAALLGVNYRRDARGQFAHSNLLTLLNADGEVVWQQAGLNVELAPTLQRIQSLPAP